MAALEKLRELDMYPKTRDEFRVRTSQGGAATVVACLVAIWLVRTEFTHTLGVETRDRLYVNSSHGNGLRVSLDLEFPHASCELLAVDANDDGGRSLEAVQHITKTRLDQRGRPLPARRAASIKQQVGGTATHEDHISADENVKAEDCGDCYGAEDDEQPCCNTCEEVQSAYRRRGWTFKPETVVQCTGKNAYDALDKGAKGVSEGCRIAGTLDLPAVAGNFHVAPGRHLKQANAFQGLDVVLLTFEQFNVSHTVNRIAFGPEHHDEPDSVGREDSRSYRRKKRRRGPPPLLANLTSQLDGQKRVLTDGYGMHQYYVKVVPTVYSYLDGSTREVWQYSVTEHVRHVTPGGGRGLPGVFFFYEVSPLVAEFEERRQGWRALLTGLAAIVGGVHATAALVDRTLAALLAKHGSRGLAN